MKNLHILLHQVNLPHIDYFQLLLRSRNKHLLGYFRQMKLIGNIMDIKDMNNNHNILCHQDQPLSDKHTTHRLVVQVISSVHMITVDLFTVNHRMNTLKSLKILIQLLNELSKKGTKTSQFRDLEALRDKLFKDHLISRTNNILSNLELDYLNLIQILLHLVIAISRMIPSTDHISHHCYNLSNLIPKDYLFVEAIRIILHLLSLKDTII